jgi:uncharacterized protein (DUF2236 family)
MPRLPDGAAFAEPEGEPALVPADSVSCRIFKNPVALFVDGVAAVILELAEPSVRTGAWEHSGFRRDPVRLHDRVTGAMPAGEAHRANDVRLLT